MAYVRGRPIEREAPGTARSLRPGRPCGGGSRGNTVRGCASAEIALPPSNRKASFIATNLFSCACKRLSPQPISFDCLTNARGGTPHSTRCLLFIFKRFRPPCSLFCATEIANSRTFLRLRALLQKHRGWGASPHPPRAKAPAHAGAWRGGRRPSIWSSFADNIFVRETFHC
jgi:hypothetical protein